MLANQVGISTKCVSERHHYASNSKLTAGQAASKLRKKGFQIKAKELVESFKLLNGREPEWHHSGFYKGAGGSTMGRTFFFSDQQIEELESRWNEVEKLKADKDQEIEAKKATIVRGFYYEWDYDYSGPRGKKRNHKVLKVYEGSELNAPKNFTSLTASGLRLAKSEEGKKYYGWDEPKASEFQL